MLCKKCRFFLFFLVCSIFISCANKEDRALSTIKKLIVEYKRRIVELDNFYKVENDGKKLSRKASTISSYYSKMSLLCDFIMAHSGELKEAKSYLVRKGKMPNFKIPRIFLKKPEYVEKIKKEINLKLSIIIPRVRKTKYSAGELKKGDVGTDHDYYSKGVKDARSKKTHAELKSELKHTAPESFSVSNVHKKYFY